MRVAIITTDSREHYGDYGVPVPSFGAAPEALLQGFGMLADGEKELEFRIADSRLGVRDSEGVRKSGHSVFDEKIEIHVISCAQKQMVSPEKLADNIWFHSLHVPKLGWLRTGYQGCIRAVRKKVSEIHPDIVHGQGTERDCALSAILSGYPNVVTIHGNMAALARHLGSRIGSFGWLAARLEDFTLPRTSGVFCNSAYTESLVSTRAKRTWRVSNPIRAPFFKPGGVRQKNQRPILMSIGHITPRKRQVETLGMLQSLHAEGHDFEVRFFGLCGEDEYGRRFRNKLEESRGAGFARYKGLVTTEELVSAMDEADALCHFPSEEAFGLVVAEALARNLKFFGSAVGGVCDIVEGVEGAELFGQNDWPSMQRGIAQWIREGFPHPSSSRHCMGERYHPGMIAGRHLEIYRQVLEESKERVPRRPAGNVSLTHG